MKEFIKGFKYMLPSLFELGQIAFILHTLLLLTAVLFYLLSKLSEGLQ